MGDKHTVSSSKELAQAYEIEDLTASRNIEYSRRKLLEVDCAALKERVKVLENFVSMVAAWPYGCGEASLGHPGRLSSACDLARKLMEPTDED